MATSGPALAGRSGLWCAAGGGQDGTDVICAPPPELNRSCEGCEQCSVTMSGLQSEDFADLPGKVRNPGGRGTGQERRRHLTECQELLFLRGLGPRCAPRLVRRDVP